MTQAEIYKMAILLTATLSERKSLKVQAAGSWSERMQQFDEKNWLYNFWLSSSPTHLRNGLDLSWITFFTEQ